MEDFAKELAHYRLEKQLTWRGFAKEVDMSEAGLWKIARGKVKAGELTEYRIRKVLDMPMDVSGVDPIGNASDDPESQPKSVD